MNIYKSANDRIMLTGIKAELAGKKKLSVSQFIEACNCIYACHLNFKLLQINKNNCILSLFRREEMFVRILTEWPFRSRPQRKISFDLVFD